MAFTVNGVDLDTIFEPIWTAPGAATGFYDGGQDLANRYEKLSSGLPYYAIPFTHNGVDLNTLFAGKGTVGTAITSIYAGNYGTVTYTGPYTAYDSKNNAYTEWTTILYTVYIAGVCTYNSTTPWVFPYVYNGNTYTAVSSVVNVNTASEIQYTYVLADAIKEPNTTIPNGWVYDQNYCYYQTLQTGVSSTTDKSGITYYYASTTYRLIRGGVVIWSSTTAPTVTYSATYGYYVTVVVGSVTYYALISSVSYTTCAAYNTGYGADPYDQRFAISVAVPVN